MRRRYANYPVVDMNDPEAVARLREYDGTKIHQDLPRLNLHEPGVAYRVSLDSVYYGYTINDLAERVNMQAPLVRQDADRLRIPYIRDNSSKFFDPRWCLPVSAHSPELGALVRKADLGDASPAGTAWPKSLRDFKGDVLSVAALALAQYKLGYLPKDICDPKSISFRDGDTNNLRPENLVYTGVVRVVPTTFRATYKEMAPIPYQYRCARCRYRLPRDQESVGWQDGDFVSLIYADQKDVRRKGKTHILRGFLCPVCQKFTDRVWNGSMG